LAADWPAPAPVLAEDFLTRDDALAEILARVALQGLAFLHGAAAAPRAVEAIVARFGFVRETNYGRLFDVRVEPRAGNLAYSAQALDLHADNPYRDPVPTLQLLHAIEVGAGGGATVFVDGFAQAAVFAEASPRHFERLCGTPVDFVHTAANGQRLQARAPVVERDLDGRTRAIRLNHRSLATATLPARDIAPWYEAYAAFHAQVHAPERRITHAWRPGDVVIFDNRRILHGRSAFAEEGGRWLQGCYADMDGLLARLAGLRRAGEIAGEHRH
jgi:gamma-butyrobetaine dioxygenase